jgi:hypothetical protein
MSDVVDTSDIIAEILLNADIQQIRQRAQIDPGVAGECDKCGDEMPRLVKGICCRCRDRHHLP